MDGTVWATEDAGESFAQLFGGLPPIGSVVVGYR
jgi:hypothetical protein